MDDLISRQAAINALGEEPEVWTDDDECSKGMLAQWQYDKRAIESLPSKSEQKKGEWIRRTRVEAVYSIDGVKTWGIKYQCNKCGFATTVVEDFGHYRFCPNCGADMRGENK